VNDSLHAISSIFNLNTFSLALIFLSKFQIYSSSKLNLLEIKIQNVSKRKALGGILKEESLELL
jgi:hypothetical protein